MATKRFACVAQCYSDRGLVLFFLFQKESEERWRNKNHHLTCSFPFFLHHKPFKYCWIFAVFLSWKKEKLLRNMVDFISSTFLPKEKEIFCQSLRWQKNSSTLFSFGYRGLPGAGFLSVQYYYLAFCLELGFRFHNLANVLSSSASKGTIKGWAFLYLSTGILWFFLVLLGLFIISCFAGLLPVFSWVLALNSLIINRSRFCMLCAFAVCFLLWL